MGLVNQVLDLAKIEADTVEIEAIPFNLGDLLHEVVTMLGVQAANKGIELACDVECIGDKTYLGDPARIRQIITNLLGNAVKFTSRGGVHVTVACRASEATNVDMVNISVADSGIGIAPEQLGSVFSKFRQADSSINRKFGGTGLGLAIARSLAERMGGNISVESELNKGSTFTFELPMEFQSAADRGQRITPLASPPKAQDVGDAPKILMVEDDEPNLIVASAYICQFGFEVDAVDNGIDAIEKIKTSTYAAVFMDVRLGGLDGLETTRLIRAHEAHHGLKPVRIVGMTAFAYAEDRDRCLAAGMDDYLAKPYEPGELHRALIPDAPDSPETE